MYKLNGKTRIILMLFFIAIILGAIGINNKNNNNKSNQENPIIKEENQVSVLSKIDGDNYVKIEDEVYIVKENGEEKKFAKRDVIVVYSDNEKCWIDYKTEKPTIYVKQGNLE